MTAPRFLDCGETALSVEFGDRIDDTLTARVLALDAGLAARPCAGVIEAVPTYRSLMLHYDPLRLSRAALIAHLRPLLDTPPAVAGGGRTWLLPACHDPSLAEDLPQVAATTGLSPDRVVALHAGAEYRVVMCGFAPGWAYLSGLPVALTLPRRPTPRDRIPDGSLIIAGGQAIVAARAMPSGWHILGRTPERLFAPSRDPVFLLAAGDRLRLAPVDLATFAALDARAAAGEIIAQALP
jgi:KipI family sensor histidine kinase inhibitor